MFDALIDGQDGHVTRARQASRLEKPLQTAEDTRRTIGCGEDAIDEVRPRQVKVVAWNRPALMRQQRRSVTKQRLDSTQSLRGCHSACWCHVPPPTGNATTGNSKS